MEIPTAKNTDAEDVVWGLQTADTLWRRGERIDALVWLRRAAQAAGDANDDDRALELARHAAQLTEWMAGEEETAARPVPGLDVIQGHAAAVVIDEVAEDVVDVIEDDVEAPHAAPVAPVISVPMTADDGRPSATSVLPAEKVHAGMFDPWADPSAKAQPGSSPAAAIPTINEPDPDEEIVTSVRPNSLVPPRSERPAIKVTVSSPPPGPVAAGLPPVASPSKPSRPSPPKPPPPLPPRAKPPVPKPSRPAAAVRGSAPAPVIEPEPVSLSQDETIQLESIPPAALSADVGELEVAAPEVSIPVSVPPAADLVGPEPTPHEATPEHPLAEPAAPLEAAAVEEAPVEAAPVEAAAVEEAPVEAAPVEVASVAPAPVEAAPVEAAPVEATPPEPAPAEAAAPAEKKELDLESVEAFTDLPDDARDAFAAAATLHSLAEGEEIGAFALAYILSGSFDVAATVVDAPAVRLAEGAVLRARGTTDENVPIRLICAQGNGVIATWSDAAVEEAFRTIPWVEDDLRASADRVQTLVGITIGPLGERLDASIREEIVGRLTMKPLSAGEVIVKEGDAVPGLLLIGIGELELVKNDKVAGVVGSGEFLFPTEVLGAGSAPMTARAGSGGALVMFGDRGIAQELLVTCPPLLEVFAGM